MARTLKVGSTNHSATIRIIDSTDGTPETGVTSATAGLDLKYRREGAVPVGITESNLSALTDAHSDGGLLHIGEGYYRVDYPDAAFAAGAEGVLLHGTATGMVVIGEYYELVAYDPQDVVRLGLTSLPNAAAGANGGVPTVDANNAVKLQSGTGANQISLASGLVTLAGVTHAGAVIPTVSTLTGHTAQTGDSFARIGVAGAGLTEAGGTGDHLTAVATPADCASPAEVATEIADALGTDTYAEPASVPGPTSSLADKIGWICALARNKLTFNKTTGAHALRNNGDSGDIATQTSSDDGTTVTRNKWA